MDLNDYRTRIDQIDDQLVKLFAERMETVVGIAKYKEEHNLPVLDAGRERKKLLALAEKSPEALREYVVSLYSLMFELSRSYQNRLLGRTTPLTQEISRAIENTPKLFPDSAVVACQGVEGANSQVACDRILPRGNIVYVKTFDAVVSAVESGLCKFGVLPIENSSTGGITEVYDLLRQADCHIVGEQCVKIEQNLLGCEGATLQSIKTVYSHPQGFKQSKEFFRDYPHMEQVPFFSTSKSAEEVAEKQDITLGAVAGKAAADLYNLKIIAPAINSNNNNYTRFIIIAKRPEIIPNANKITLIVAVKHETGSLYKMLASFYHTGLNMMNLQSRPMVGKSWEYFFYIDVTGNLSDPLVADVMEEVKAKSTYVKVLGNYRAYEKKE